MVEDQADLLQRARAWIAHDPDAETRAELQALVDSNDLEQLTERMCGTLEFGTAGLRAVVGAGSARMNHAVVIRTTRGLAEHLLATQPDARSLPVIVGYDGRVAGRDFAETAAGVLVAAGLPVRFFDSPVPTPLLAYAARQLSATAAVMITASHNPREYNGYKLYDSSAALVASPADEQIAGRIRAVGPASGVPRTERVLQGASDRAERVPDSLFERYLSQVDTWRPAGPADRSLKIVYTPLHGVGWPFFERALRRAGFSDLSVVEEQAEPDGRFPTTPVPNPEDPAALELATALARRLEADLIIANDPDGDRMAISLPTVTGRWALLTGNQIGLLLADFLLAHAQRVPQPLVVSTVVSSPLLEAIASAHGARVEWTLTGFKWIARAARQLEQSARARCVLGYEEALGYSVGSTVRDKDGISAALLFADLAAHCRAQDLTVRDRLEQLYRSHGLWVSAQLGILRPGAEGAAQIEAAMAKLATEAPEAVCGRRVASSVDFSAGAEQRPAWQPAASLVGLDFGDGGRVRVRPSGTEPKLKIYVDLRAAIPDGGSVRELEEQAQAEAEAVAQKVAEYVGIA